MKYLIAGLGNIGEEYKNTRHNIGFMVLDSLISESNTCFKPDRYAATSLFKHKGRQLVLIKPTTYMNLSGKAIRYWLDKEKIPNENLLVIVDDIALPFTTIRIKGEGSDGGHNGLKSINEMLNTTSYARMRFGIGNNFSKGKQSDFVLGNFSEEECKVLPSSISKMCDAIKCFCTLNLSQTMTRYNFTPRPL